MKKTIILFPVAILMILESSHAKNETSTKDTDKMFSILLEKLVQLNIEMDNIEESNKKLKEEILKKIEEVIKTKNNIDRKQIEQIVNKIINMRLSKLENKQKEIEQKIKKQNEKINQIYKLYTNKDISEKDISEKKEKEIVKLFNQCDKEPKTFGDLYIYYQVGVYYPTGLKYAYKIAKTYQDSCPFLKKIIYKGKEAYRLLLVDSENIKNLKTIKIFYTKNLISDKSDKDNEFYIKATIKQKSGITEEN